jgi:hypothetical protein
MKINTKLVFEAELVANIPDSGVMGLVNPQAILQQASKLVNPILHKALMGAISQLKLLGVEIKMVNSSANFTQES